MAGVSWTRPTGHPAAQVKTGEAFADTVEPVESPRPSRPVSSEAIDRAAAAAADVEAARELKGEDLDTALEKAGLTKTGSADEKRQRLAEYRSAGNQG